MDDNRIRTPNRKKIELTPTLSTPNRNHPLINTEEQIKIYLAEIFMLNKMIERLTNNISNSEKNEETQSQKAIKLQKDILIKEEQAKKQIDNLIVVIDDLKEKNSLLQKESDYNHLIDYYETKIEETQNKNISNIKMFSEAINKLMKDIYYNNKDEVWRNLIKKYEKKFEELEKTICQYEKNERKIISRQKFFEKYCYKAEEKFERIAKISKNYEIKDKETNQLKQELNKFKENLNKEHIQKEIIASDLVELKNEHHVLKQFVNKIKVNPINRDQNIKALKEEKWSEIKKINEDNIKLLSYQESHPISYDDKAIIILIKNLKEYIEILNSNRLPNDTEISTNLISILNDIENYTRMLFDKLHILLLNQSYIIDSVCDLSNQIVPEQKKKGKQDPTVSKYLAILKSVCSKLVHDYTPY